MRIELVPPEKAYQLAELFPNISYTKEFSCFQAKRYGANCLFLGVYQGDSLICIFPVDYFAKGMAFSVFKDYTEPLFTDNKQKINWREVLAIAKKKLDCNYFELTFGAIDSPDDYFDQWQKTGLSLFVLRVGEGLDRNSFFKIFDKKTRNQIRKGEKENFNFQIGGMEFAKIFYVLYKENMERHGSPAKPFDFFLDLFESYGKKCQLLMVFNGDLMIGANMVVVNGCYLRLLFNVSMTEYWQFCVNNLLYYNTIEWGYGLGVRTFDFGPGSNKDTSHNHFKLGFGAKQLPILKIRQGSIWHSLSTFIKQKKYNLIIRFNKLWKILN